MIDLRYVDEPFTSLQPEAVFNTAQYLLNTLYHRQKKLRVQNPTGISLVYCLYALSKQARSSSAYKLTRQVLQLLLTLRIPDSWKDQVELSWLTIRSKPFTDKVCDSAMDPSVAQAPCGRRSCFLSASAVVHGTHC